MKAIVFDCDGVLVDNEKKELKFHNHHLVFLTKREKYTRFMNFLIKLYFLANCERAIVLKNSPIHFG